MAGGAGSCLQYLSQRVGGFAVGTVQKEGCSLQALQSGTLALFYLALSHKHRSEHVIICVHSSQRFRQWKGSVHWSTRQGVFCLVIIQGCIGSIFVLDPLSWVHVCTFPSQSPLVWCHLTSSCQHWTVSSPSIPTSTCWCMVDKPSTNVEFTKMSIWEHSFPLSYVQLKNNGTAEKQ